MLNIATNVVQEHQLLRSKVIFLLTSNQSKCKVQSAKLKIQRKNKGENVYYRMLFVTTFRKNNTMTKMATEWR